MPKPTNLLKNKKTISTEAVLILSVFIVASCGLAYELISGALASYILGDSVLQFSIIIGLYLFAMGIGAHFSKYVSNQHLIDRFIDIELLVGLIGGLSASFLYVAYASMDVDFSALLYGLVVMIGILVGMEIPLVMRIFHAKKTAFNDLVSKVLTFDYMGALVVSLVFPLFLAPNLGLAKSAIVFGVLNVVIALWTVIHFQNELHHPKRVLLKGLLVLGVLSGAFVIADRLVSWSERRLYGDEVIYAKTTPYQRIVVTQWKDDTRLFLNGNLQFSSKDEHRYHEALVHPALSSIPDVKNVLVLGGGDGLAVREILKYPSIKHITLVDLDPNITQFFATNQPMRALNQDALNHAKVTVINDDARQWLMQNSQIFDVIIADFPDPSNYSVGKLYTVSMYQLLQKHLSQQGLVVVQSTSPYYAPRAFWSIDKSMQSAGLNTYPYHVHVPSFGDWGYIMGTKTQYRLPTDLHVPLKFLDNNMLKQLFIFPKDMQPMDVEKNTLNHQKLVTYYRQDWEQIVRK